MAVLYALWEGKSRELQQCVYIYILGAKFQSPIYIIYILWKSGVIRLSLLIRFDYLNIKTITIYNTAVFIYIMLMIVYT